jgi:ParB family chromosome partitioning protein
MARKNPFEKLLNDSTTNAESNGLPKANYAAKGASRSIMSTLDDLTDKADKLLEGETVIKLDPKLIDPSFLIDRLEDDQEELEKLSKAIKEEGQNTPILVRPHPTSSGRYMIVFGSRRKKVAEHLGIPVRAIIKELSDRDHAVAQGQENAARANLSFIERAMLAAKVVQEKYDIDNSTAMSALSIDKTTLSKMLSVCSISEAILVSLGAAKSAGRDRWYELKTLLDRPVNLKHALELIQEKSFVSCDFDQRFDMLFNSLKGKKKTTKLLNPKPKKWMPEDKRVSVDHNPKGKSYIIAVKAKDDSALEFGEFISNNLNAYYQAFNKQKLN